MEKYSWKLNSDGKFDIIHTEGETTTTVATSDHAEQAHFIAAACNEFDVEKYEQKMRG